MKILRRSARIPGQFLLQLFLSPETRVPVLCKKHFNIDDSRKARPTAFYGSKRQCVSKAKTHK